MRHYLRAVQDGGTLDAAAVAAQMRKTPVTDMNNRDVAIRADGRVMVDMYLMRVKTPAESTRRFDVYKPIATVPGAEAFRPLNEGGCPLVRA